MSEHDTEKVATRSFCECAYWTVHAENDVDEGVDYTTGCEGGQTDHDFIRGHDAKLKSLFILAGKNDWEVSRLQDGVGVRSDWRTALVNGGFGFSFQVEDSVQKHHAKAAKKAEAEADSPEEPPALDATAGPDEDSDDADSDF